MICALSLLLAARALPVVIEHVTVIVPGKTRVMLGQTVMLDHGRFTYVGPDSRARVPASAIHIDGTGRFLIPGLWDMHVHWYKEDSLNLFTANGVTGVRIMFGQPIHKAWRSRSEEPGWTGPRFIVGSPIVDGAHANWPGSIELKSPAGAEELVAKLKSEGWDFIKVYSSLRADSFRALAAEAKKQRMPFEGHLPDAINLLEAAQLGQRTLEHLGGVRDSCTAHENELRSMLVRAMEADDRIKALDAGYADLAKRFPKLQMDPKIAEETFRKLSKTNMWQCPTLTVLRAIGNLNEPTFLADLRLKYLPQDIRTNWDPKNDERFKNNTQDDWDYWKTDYEKKFKIVKLLRDTGNRFLAGTDCLNPYCFPGFSLHDELALLVEAGLTPTQALEAATTNPARYMHQEKQWGSIVKGQRADAVLLSRNPLEDIHNTTSIVAVIRGGRAFLRSELDSMLKSNEH